MTTLLYDHNILCSNIKKLRKAHNLTQRQMAEICKISVASLRKLENNIIPPRLSVEILFNIYKHFDLTPSELFSDIKLM